MTAVRVPNARLREILSVSADHFGAGGTLVGDYIDDAQRWIENQLVTREFVTIDTAMVDELVNNVEIEREVAELHAVVDVLSAEFDAKQELVPDSIAFSPVLD